MSEDLTVKERKHISPSEVREFLGCPLRWWYRYRLGLWTDSTTSFFAMGNAVHAGLERYYISEALTSQRDREGALGLYTRAWLDESKGVDWDKEPGKDPFAVRQTGTGLLTALMDEGDDWLAAKAEETLYADIAHSRLGKLPYQLKVRLDMRTSTNDVVEHKTADKTWEKGREDGDTQATAEVMVVRANFGHDPTVTFNIAVANVKPKVDRRPTRRDQDAIDRLYVAVRAILDAEEKGVVFPNPTAFAHRTCEFRLLCDGWTEHPQRVPSGRVLQSMVPHLGDYAARVPGATWGGKR